MALGRNRPRRRSVVRDRGPDPDECGRRRAGSDGRRSPLRGRSTRRRRGRRAARSSARAVSSAGSPATTPAGPRSTRTPRGLGQTERGRSVSGGRSRSARRPTGRRHRVTDKDLVSDAYKSSTTGEVAAAQPIEEDPAAGLGLASALMTIQSTQIDTQTFEQAASGQPAGTFVASESPDTSGGWVESAAAGTEPTGDAAGGAHRTPAAARRTPAAAPRTPVAAQRTPAARQIPAAARPTPAAARRTPAAARPDGGAPSDAGASSDPGMSSDAGAQVSDAGASQTVEAAPSDSAPSDAAPPSDPAPEVSSPPPPPPEAPPPSD